MTKKSGTPTQKRAVAATTHEAARAGTDWPRSVWR
jgi:hypothetical protein